MNMDDEKEKKSKKKRSRVGSWAGNVQLYLLADVDCWAQMNVCLKAPKV